jgi:hypothetical protein
MGSFSCPDQTARLKRLHPGLQAPGPPSNMPVMNHWVKSIISLDTGRLLPVFCLFIRYPLRNEAPGTKATEAGWMQIVLGPG